MVLGENVGEYKLIMKKELKLGFADTFPNCINFFTDWLSERYDITRDDVNPDYLIFGDRNFGETHYRYNCKKIFFTGENVRPNYFTYDHAITFDHINSSFHYRLPLYVLEMWAISKEEGPWNNKYLYLVNKNIDIEKENDLKQNGFSYVQSNPNVERRNQVFDYIEAKNQKIYSGGPHKNNTGFIVDRPGGHKNKIDFISKYKFNIAFENGSYPGYSTEKLLNAFYANTIPIYWGSSTIHRDFNTKAFVDYTPDLNGAYNGFDRIWSQIEHLINDKQAYLDMLSQPAFVDNIPNEFTYKNNFLNFWEVFVE